MNGAQHNATRGIVCFVGAVVIAALSKIATGYLQAYLGIGLFLLAAAFGLSALFEEKR